MGAKKSAEVKQARKLLGTMSFAEAARTSGITPGAITRDPESQAIIAVVGRYPGKGEQAFNLANERKISYAEAARKIGVSRQAIHEFIKRQKIRESNK